tara:strand:+ start:6076 stop:7059 length:984 start_codon:yes stop_codon:yes gene_type:complete
MSNSTDYKFWHNAMVGKPQPVHEGEAWPGFWYQRSKTGPRRPVATWRDESGELVALVGFETGARQSLAVDIWTYICQHPVEEETYRKAFETGVWPDDPPKVFAPTSDGDDRPNMPAGNDAATFAEELAGEQELAEQFLATSIETKQDADRAAVWAKRLNELAKRADDHRKVEKEPFLVGGREIDAKWGEIITDAKDLTSRLKKHVEPYLIAQKKADDEKRRTEEEKARKLREEADKVNDPDTKAEAIQAAQEAEESAKQKSAGAGRTGARVSLRTEKRAKIVDFDACYEALKVHPEMRALVEALASRAVRSGVSLPGVEVEEYQKAV